MPVPSSPNQIHSIHFEIVMGPCRPSASQKRERKKPAKHQTANSVSTVKSLIISRSEMKSMFSESTLKASRGISTGAATAKTSKACCAGTS